MYDSGAIIIPFADAQVAGCTTGSACPLSITVYGVTSTAYSITSASNAAIEVLNPGVPQSSFVAAGTYEYFQFTTSTPNSGLQIVLTQITGDADVFVSTITQQPTFSNFTWYAVGLNDEFINIPAGSKGWVSAPATYYIGVYGFTNATYTMMAFETANPSNAPAPLVTLIDGTPQAGQTPAGHTFSYYNFTVVSDSDLLSPVDVFASEEIGSVDIYVLVNANPGGPFPSVFCADPNPSAPNGCNEYSVDPQTYTYTSTGSAQADFLSIPTSALTPGQSIVIGVLSTTPDSNGQPAGPSSFDLTVTSSATGMTELQSGVGAQGVAGPGVYKYYSFQSTAWGNDIVVNTLMAAGAVDLFVSESPMPVAGNSTWNTTTSAGGIAGNDVVYIPFGSLSITCRYAMIRGLPCTLYISVLGWQNMQAPTAAYYTLTAAISGSTYFPVRLQEGRLDRRPVPVAGYQYYLATVNITQGDSIYAIAQDYSGSSVLYASLGNSSSKTFATPANGMAADAYSADLGGFAVVTFSPPASSSSASVSVSSAPASTTSARGLTRLAPDLSVDIVDGGKVMLRLTDTRYLHKYRPALVTEALNAAVAAASASTPTRELASTTSQAPLTAPSPYCTSLCNLYLTVAALGPAPSDVVLYYTDGATALPLEANSAPLGAMLLQNETDYYTVYVRDPLDDLTLTISQQFGAVNAYVMVQSPRRPYQMPSANLWQWQLRPWTGSGRLTISHNDAAFCKSHDGTVTTAPCTFVVAIKPRFTAAPRAEYSIAAAVNSSLVITPLQDGVGFASSVIEGAYTYFSFSASTSPSSIVAPVLIDAEALEGRVNIYVTNAYIPGVTPSTYLPGAGNTAICQWSNGNFSAIYIQSTDPCFMAGRQVYTIAVQGATGIAQPVPSPFIVTATDNGFLIRNIPFGTPRFNQVVWPNMNANYSYALQDASEDVVVAATSTHGDVAMMIAPFDPANPVLPSCSKAASGAQAVCSGYAILTYGNNMASGVGSTAAYIPAYNACNAYAGYGMPAPVINQTACAAWNAAAQAARASGIGLSIAVVIYGFDRAEYAVSVQGEGTSMQLADGQPQLMMTTPFTFCGSRDNTTGQCTGGGTWTQASAGFVTFTVPASYPQVDQYVMVERICPGMVDGNCGNPLHLYASACAAGACQAMDSYPFWGWNYDDDAVVMGTIGSIGFPSCYGPNGQPGLGADACVYTVGIFPICGNPLSPPGQGCSNNLVRVTWMGSTGIDRIPSDCFSLGSTCTLPAENLGTLPNAVRRYEAYAGDLPTGTIIRVEACAGDVVASLCKLGTGTACNPSSAVSPTNFDYQASTRTNSNTRTATFTLQLTGGFFLGVSADPQSAIPDPEFDVILSSGTGQRLSSPPDGVCPAARWDATGSNLVVGWEQAILVAGGQLNQPANNAMYSVYAFPSLLAPRYNMEAACGVDAAFAQTQGFIANASTMGTDYIFAGLDNTRGYQIALTVYCPAGSCLTAEQQGQRIAYIPIVVGPYVPGPSPSPTAAPAPAPTNPSNAGPVAGGVIGSLIGVAIVGALLYFLVLRPGAPYACKKADSGGRYGSLNSSDTMTEGMVSSYASGTVAGADDTAGGGYSSL